MSGVRSLLRTVPPSATEFWRRRATSQQVTRDAEAIVDTVRTGGESALREYALRFDGIEGHEPWMFDQAALRRAVASLDRDVRALLERTAERIATFAGAQRAALSNIDLSVTGGRAGHTVVPMHRAGCYAPGGRYPLPSSVLMTAVTARVAGVREVYVATPRPGSLMLAAAGIANADAVFGVGGAHAIAALAYGVAVPACDIVVGPGNAYVTAAKRYVAGAVAIDMLAGPSELVIVADGTAHPDLIAADLIAQAEHDPDARVALVTSDPRVAAEAGEQLDAQLAGFPNPAARESLAHAIAIVCSGRAEMLDVCDRLAPEHLQLSVHNAGEFASQVRNAGAVFIGEQSAEVFGDYGIGGNHVLPTGGTARYASGLSALTFLRVRTWLELSSAGSVVQDVAHLARLERLEGHARAAERRSAAT